MKYTRDNMEMTKDQAELWDTVMENLQKAVDRWHAEDENATENPYTTAVLNWMLGIR